ncbi:MAG: VOC family protein [Candidatus Latescibacteria bacterium]|jgi:glyoxylase I family protein|nr:VOC family protein [Candidatus Latescibacterota bacterium]MBT4138999.1 VOC family protein [Candidatus Latescibacterota bacterium]MBT5830601.1 VOC family protein [Candidatus Latescibacterota bacterium]
MYSGIEHTAIAANDTTALAAWYCEIFGFSIAYQNQKDPPTFFVKLGQGLLEIIPANESQRNDRENADLGLSHFAISVDDFDAAVAELASKDVEVTGIREASGGVQVGFVADPENNALQIIRRPNPL